MGTRNSYFLLITFSFFLSGNNYAQEQQILKTRGLVAYWDFATYNNGYTSKGKNKLLLKSGTSNNIAVAEDGPLSGKSIKLSGKDFLFIPYNETGALNVQTNTVTVVAWVKWTGEQTGFVAGMWNEYEDGGKRQYGLFASLPYYNGANQVCGHISKTGRATPPFPYSIDYAASKQAITPNTWVCIAFTYDGKYIRSYLDGVFEKRAPELINNTRGFEGFPDGLIQSKNPYYFPDGIGDNGSDFTVGAVMLKRGMGNFFKGQIGGIAVFNRALRKRELKRLATFNRKLNS